MDPLLRPNDRDLLIRKGDRYGTLSEFEKAVETYKDAIKLDENWSLAHYGLGVTLQQMGKYGEAIKAYQRALKADGLVLQSDITGRIAECRYQMLQSPGR